eukprot:SRR837773.12734.p3 GENE.SRR837773.12734~~SRR837773.12734.p3  ORF type:complete len:127 (+),score=80.09 SRR837773.12734:199-579(+)
MAEFKDSPTSLVADVDCTTEGQPLCEKYGVQGYPTIKYGDPEDMKDYQGGRSFADLKKFAEENLGPTCGPGENIGLCDAATRKKIEGYLAMSESQLDEKVQKIVKTYEVEIPVMKKVVGYLKSKDR